MNFSIEPQTHPITRRWTNVCLILAHPLRCRPNNKPALGPCLAFNVQGEYSAGAQWYLWHFSVTNQHLAALSSNDSDHGHGNTKPQGSEIFTFTARGSTLDVRFLRLKSITALKGHNIYNGRTPITEVFKWSKKRWLIHLWWFQIEKTFVLLVYIKKIFSAL